ncbi:MAG: ketoacyl-ACP synthase III [Chloroflexi bacterium]|nr:MAG: ketoacyl-ACP synthase III [Chloroflexota bacterium]
MARYAHITGWGMGVPEKVLTNCELMQTVDTTDEWIRSRTGITERRIAANEDTTASLAAEAAIQALRTANVKPDQVDLVIVATSSPEHIFPATACIVQDRIGAVNAGAFDLLAACTGFIFALNMGTQSIRSGSADTVLVIGAETLSRIINWKDRETCILFGDGAGAFLLQASDEPGGVLSAVMRSDGSGADLLSLPAGGSRMPASAQSVQNGDHYLRMNGREVFRFATRVMVSATKEVLEAAQVKKEDVKLFVPHQANSRIIEAAARGLDIPLDRCMLNLDRYGNTSTASIPIAVCEALEKGRLTPGDKTVFVGFGAGLTWGSCLVQWTGPFTGKKRVHPERYRLLARVRSLILRLVRRIEGIIWGR